MEEVDRLLHLEEGRNVVLGYELVRMRYQDRVNNRMHALRVFYCHESKKCRQAAETEERMRQEETIRREILEQRIDRELEALSEKLFGKSWRMQAMSRFMLHCCIW